MKSELMKFFLLNYIDAEIEVGIKLRKRWK